MKAHPFIKWVGGKATLVQTLLPLMPTSISTYYEPFIGGGAMFFAVADTQRFQRAVVNDWNADLVNVYRVVRDFPDELMAFLRTIEESYTENPSGIYEAWRNPPPHQVMHAFQRAGRFIFLNKSCFNGLYRVNKKGQFNSPWGHRPTVNTHEPENILACAEVLNRFVMLRQGDFSDAVGDATEGDFVYFDPPYVPLNPTSNFTSYTSDGFSMDDQHRLSVLFRTLADRGVSMMLSNSDTPEVRALYAGFRLLEVQMGRNINSKGEGRAAVGELVVLSQRDDSTLSVEHEKLVKALVDARAAKAFVEEPEAPAPMFEFDEEPDPAG